VTTGEPERPVFVSDHARRRRMLRLAGLTCATLVGLWVTAVVLGALGDPLPGLSVVTLKPSTTPRPPAAAARPHSTPAPARSAVATLAPAAGTPLAAKPIPATASAVTAPVSYTPQPARATPARPRKRHAPAHQHRGATHTQTTGGVEPGRTQLAVRHPIRRTHRQRHPTV